jgi:ArsR family transcriptional regulator
MKTSTADRKRGSAKRGGRREAGPSSGEGDVTEAGSAALAQTLKALAHPARVRIMEIIHERGGEICVCEFAGRLDLSQPTISHHLKILREAGLIESRQQGTWVYHTVRRDAVAALAESLGVWSRRPETGEPGASCCAPGARSG